MDEVQEVLDVTGLEADVAALESDAEALEAIYMQLSWASHRRLEQDLNAYGLTAPQYIALHCIEENDNRCSMSRLAEAARQVSATMTGIVDRLVDRGLVQRERDPNDRRALHVALTSQGRELMERVRAGKKAWMRSALSTLSAAERREMIRLAQRYLEILGENS